MKMGMGTHLLVNLYGCPVEVLKKSKVVLKLLNEVVKEAKLHKVGDSHFQFKPFGATAVVLLAESHISIHTWPEKNGMAALDIFTCGKEGDAHEASSVLVKKFKPTKIEIKRVRR